MLFQRWESDRYSDLASFRRFLNLVFFIGYFVIICYQISNTMSKKSIGVFIEAFISLRWNNLFKRFQKNVKVTKTKLIYAQFIDMHNESCNIAYFKLIICAITGNVFKTFYNVIAWEKKSLKEKILINDCWSTERREVYIFHALVHGSQWKRTKHVDVRYSIAIMWFWELKIWKSEAYA